MTREVEAGPGCPACGSKLLPSGIQVAGQNGGECYLAFGESLPFGRNRVTPAAPVGDGLGVVRNGRFCRQQHRHRINRQPHQIIDIQFARLLIVRQIAPHDKSIKVEQVERGDKANDTQQQPHGKPLRPSPQRQQKPAQQHRQPTNKNKNNQPQVGIAKGGLIQCHAPPRRNQHHQHKTHHEARQDVEPANLPLVFPPRQPI